MSQNTVQKKSYSEVISKKNSKSQQRIVQLAVRANNKDSHCVDQSDPQKQTADDDGFVVVNRRGTKSSTASGSSIPRTTAPRKQVQLGVRNNVKIKTVPKVTRPQMKALFVSCFAPEVQDDDTIAYINQEIKVANLRVAKLKTKYNLVPLST
ncbi:hypothetical protein PR048_010181 [Dryococelus australis]|uniref:Uncharacterized protein n=1 Tax=Dryococelus australis TaxID=614101 RepID=A0ABQ9I1Z2_9NEOP|nr:hypothetical protein PR048_010181 [Dryococelus australis]